MRRGELNAMAKRGGPSTIKVGLVYPSAYSASIASLSYQSMYYYINSREEFLAERFVYEGDGPPSGIERGSSLSSMDAIIASVHYELDYANILRMLMSARVEVERDRRRSRPPLIVGGPPLIANPLPLSGVADVITVGELEPLLPMLLDALAKDPRAVGDALAGIPGFFVAGSEGVRRAYAEELTLEFHPIAQIQPPDDQAIWGRSLLVESMRGCFRGCRFCLEGHAFLPKRDRPVQQIEAILGEGLPANGVDKATFYSLSFFDHQRADYILGLVRELGAHASLPSLRLDTLDDSRIASLAALGQRTMTVAPESSSCRLRGALNKALADGLLLKAARAASSNGIRHLKLYYMVGLPGEMRDDVEGIVREVISLRRDAGPLDLEVSLTPFMPKPGTPMQWMPMEAVDSLRRKMSTVSSALRRGGVKADFYSPRLAAQQMVLARGGPEVLCPLELMAAGERWDAAISRCGLRPDRYIGPLDPDLMYPWSVVDMGFPPGYLRRGHDAYLEAIAHGCSAAG